MQRVKINGQEYRLPTTVDDVVLKDFIEWTEIESAEMPKELRQITEEPDHEKRKFMVARLSKRAYIFRLVPYYIKIVSLISGIPESVLKGDRKREGAPVQVIEAWYWQTVNALAAFKHDAGRRRFLIDGEAWELPAEHMKGSAFGEFAEAAQYEDYAADVAAGNWSRMPYVMAVLLKKEGEQYDPDLWGNESFVEQRAEIMRQQTMGLVYQVSFFLLQLNESLKIDSLIYTQAQALAMLKRARPH